jgi:Spy/CpxP family protein refolding chaperone
MNSRSVWLLAAIMLVSAGTAFAQDYGSAPAGDRQRYEKRAAPRDGSGDRQDWNQDGQNGQDRQGDPAGPGGMRGGMGMHRPMRGRGMGGWGQGMGAGLQLTDEQRDRMREIRDRQMRRGIEARADLALARLDLRKLMQADRPELTAIDAQIDRVARMRSDLAKSRVASMLEVRDVLTPEQFRRMRDMRARGPMGRRGGGQGMRQGMRDNDGSDDGPRDGDGSN